MTRRSTSLAALIVLGLSFRTGSPCFAQIAEGSGAPIVLSRSVLVSGMAGLSSESIAEVAAALGRRLKRHEPSSHVFEISLYAKPNARLSDDMVFYFLTVQTDEHGTELSETHQDELWERVRKELERSLRVVQDTVLMDRAQAMQSRIDDLEVRRAQYLRELEKVLEESEALGGESDGPMEELTAQLVDAVKRLRELQLDRISIDARRQAIETRIDELRKAADADAKEDPVLTELQRIVEIRDDQLAKLRALYDVGNELAGGVELNEAKASLAQARIELLKAERASMDQSSGALLQEFNNELSKLFVEDAEVTARIAALEELTGDLRKRTSMTTRRAIDEIRERVETFKVRAASADQARAELLERKLIDMNTQHAITIRPLEDVIAPPSEAEDSKEAP